MAHNTLVRAALAAWDAPAPVMASECWKLDLNQFQSINGDLGGVWAPPNGSPVELGGSGLKVSGPLLTTGSTIFSNGFRANAQSFVDDTLLVDQIVVFNPSEFEDLCEFFGDVHAYEDFTIDGSLDCWDPVAIHDDFSVLSGHHVSLHSPVECFDTLDVEGVADFQESVTFHDTVDLNHNTTVHSSATFTANGPALFLEGTEFHDTVDMFHDLTIHSGGTFQTLGPVVLGNSSADSIDIVGTMVIEQRLVFGGVGRVPMRPVIGPNSAAFYGVADANVVWTPSLTDDHTYVITDGGAHDGDEMLFSTAESTHILTIETPDGSRRSIRADPEQPNWLRYIRIGGTWRLVQRFAT